MNTVLTESQRMLKLIFVLMFIQHFYICLLLILKGKSTINKKVYKASCCASNITLYKFIAY